MPEQLPPGVFIDDVGGPKPIDGVSTNIAGFLGPTERGPEDIRHIRSWDEYCLWFGGHLGVDRTFMSYAVQVCPD